ncbi:MAG: LamG domain-containing protein [Candidatus Poribacteria bacterium]|nr:LamG domain-containing protein [Candidatus Poribacteria bacterium]
MNTLRRLSSAMLIGVAAALSLSAVAQVDESLVLWLTFDDANNATELDVSGHGNDATLKGSAERGAGKYGSGIVLENGAWAEVPHSDDLNVTAEQTLMLWANIPAVSGDFQMGIEKGNVWAPGEYALMPVWTNGALWQSFDLPAACADAVFGGTVIGQGWVHVAGVFDGESITIYVTGESVKQGDCAGNLQTNTGALYIGSRGGTVRWTVGTYDDVKVFSRALTQADVRTQMGELDPNLAVDARDRATVVWGILKSSSR